MKIGVPLDMTAERRKRLMQASQKVTELLIEVTEGPLEAFYLLQRLSEEWSRYYGITGVVNATEITGPRTQ